MYIVVTKNARKGLWLVKPNKK